MALNVSALTRPGSSSRQASAGSVAKNMLGVLETIGRSGPITRTQLLADLSLSSWMLKHALDLLEDQGWIRARISDGAYELSPRFCAFLDDAYAAAPETSEIDTIMAMAARSGRLTVTIGVFEAPGVFRIIDSTHPGPSIGAPVSLVLNDLAVAAQSALSAEAFEAHTQAYHKHSALPGEAAMMLRGEHHDFIASIADTGILWSADDVAFCVPVRFRTGAIGAIGFEIRHAPSSIPLFLRQLANRILSGRDGGDAKCSLSQIAHALRVFMEFDGHIDDPREV